MLSSETFLRAGMQLLLQDPPKRLLTKTFGEGWRAPLLHVSRFGPVVAALRNETVVLGGCYLLDTIRQFYKVVGPNGRIVAIEANPQIADQMRRDLTQDPLLRHASNVTLVSKGVWDKPGKMTFIANDATDNPALDKIEDAKLREFSYSKVDATKRVEIEVDSLDNILSELGIHKVDYVVLTINDAELLALDGVDRLIRNNPNVRFFVNSHCPYPCEEVKKKLTEKGYRVSASMIRGSSLEKIYAFRDGGSSS